MAVNSTYRHYIGVDVSKDKLDLTVTFNNTFLFHKEIPNDPSSIDSFLNSLKEQPKYSNSKSVFGLEQTGIYSSFLIKCLTKRKAKIVIEHPLQIRNSLGVLRGKYDKVDSLRIAQYLYKSRDELRIWKQKRKVILELAHLSTLRSRLVEINKMLKVPLNEQALFVDTSISKQSNNLCMESLSSINSDILKVDQAIKAIIDNDIELIRLMQLVTSVPSIGPTTALQIIISTNEFKDITNPKKFASYSGVAPFKDDSGKSNKKARVSTLANKKVKALLHICAVGSITHNQELKAYFKRKTTIEGKSKMAVINAIRYKLILRVFACVSQNRTYEKEYIRESSHVVAISVK